MTDARSRVNNQTRGEWLESPPPVQPPDPPSPKPSAESERVAQELGERVEKYKRGGA